MSLSVPLQEWLDFLQQEVRIAVVFSGDPNEPDSVIERTSNPRSWKSYREAAQSIRDALRELGFNQVELLSEGRELIRAAQEKRFQLFWLNSGGVQGRSAISHASSLLESLGYPYIGQTPIQSALLDDKILMKQWLRGVGLPTAPFVVRSSATTLSLSRNDSDYVREFGPFYDGPFVVKPAVGRGSVLVTTVNRLQDLGQAIEEVERASGDRVIIEPLVAGQEYCVWAAGGLHVREGRVISRQSVMTFGQAERLYDLKRGIYKKSARSLESEHCRPLSESESLYRQDLAWLARMVFSGLGLILPVRLDVRLDMEGNFQILEVNPKPDLSPPLPDSCGLLSVALSDLGSSYSDLILKSLLDWLDFHLRFSPASLALLSSLRGLPRAAG